MQDFANNMKRQDIRTYEQAVEYLLSIPRFTQEKSWNLPRKNTLEDTRVFLHSLGDPDKKLRIIHVAGTNGKGSVCAFMRSILEAGGKRVCVFTSPHLVEVTERFYVCGKEVEREAFLQAFLQVYDKLDWELLEENRGYHPSFFEFLFFIAMVLFEKAQPDFCILETGLGGRLDATNSVSHKELCVLTSISLDHTEYLGDTLEKIAGEKAGIMKPSVATVALQGAEEVNKVFCNTARNLDCYLYFVSKEAVHSLKKGNKTIDFSISSDYYKNIRISLKGQALYQVENCLLAIKGLEVLLGDQLSKRMIEDGAASCFWQGRMEEILPDVFVDGAHNEDGIEAFLDSVGNDGFDGNRILFVSIVKEKAYEKMIKRLVESGLFYKLVTAPIDNKRALSREELETCIRRGMEECSGEISFIVKNSVEEGMEELLSRKQERERIYIAGSLYLVGEVKRYLQEHRV